MLFVQNNSEYCNEIDIKMREYEGFVNTGSEILDMLLWQKSSDAIKKGIEIETVVEELDLSLLMILIYALL